MTTRSLSESQARALDALARRVRRGQAPHARGPADGRPPKPAKPVSKAALDALRRVERELARATPETAATTILAVMREVHGLDPLTIEVARAGMVGRLAALGVADAESAADTAFAHYGLTREAAS